MNICRVWRESTDSSQKLTQKGLRYDAGYWIAEIRGEVWNSYDVISRIKVSQAEWQEILQPHSVPRLPRECFSLEEFEYHQISPQSFQIEGWIVEESPLPLPQEKQEVQTILQALTLVAQQMQEQPRAQVQMQVSQPEQQRQQHRRNKKPMNSEHSSSNQSYHERQQPRYPKQPVVHSQQRKSRSEVDQHSRPQNPVHSWTPLELHLTLPSQPQQQGASFQNQKGKQRSSLEQPKKLPRRLQQRHSNPSYLKTHQQTSLVCQIQD